MLKLSTLRLNVMGWRNVDIYTGLPICSQTCFKYMNNTLTFTFFNACTSDRWISR